MLTTFSGTVGGQVRQVLLYKESIHKILMEELDMRKVCAKTVSKVQTQG
jgi:hypothetical protein